MTWRTVKLKEVISHRKGFIEIDDETEYKLVTIKLHRKGVFLRENLKGFQIRTKKQQICKTGDFIVAEMDAKVGGYGFIPEFLDGAIVSSHYFLFEVNENKLRPHYLEVISQLKVLQEQIKAVGSTNYAAIRPYNVLDWEIPLPPIDKQKEIENLYIAAKSRVDCLNEEFIEQLTLLDQLNQAILQEAVQGKLVPQDPKDEPAGELLKRIKAEKAKSGKKEKPLPPIKPEEIPFEIPGNWVWCRLGDAGNLKRGKSKHRPRNDNRLFIDGKYPFIQTGDVAKAKNNNNLITTINGYYNSFGLAQSEMQSKGTLCITIAANIAECGFLDFDACVPDSIVCFHSIDKSTEIYIYHYLKLAKADLERFAPATAQKNINLGILNDLPIPLPPLSEQKRIVSEIEKQLTKTKQLKEHIIANRQATEQLLKALLHQAFEPGQKVDQESLTATL